MKLYQFLLPIADNTGKSYHDAITLWQSKALHLAGGYSLHGYVNGAWSEGVIIYHDTLVDLHLACDQDIYEALVAATFDLFPDQLAIFTAEIGTAHIINRV